MNAKGFKNMDLDGLYFTCAFAHCLMNTETGKEYREDMFNTLSRNIAESFQIEPLEYTKERADNFREEMINHVKMSLLKKEHIKKEFKKTEFKKKGDKNERLEQSNCKTVQNDGDQKKI